MDLLTRSREAPAADLAPERDGVLEALHDEPDEYGRATFSKRIDLGYRQGSSVACSLSVYPRLCTKVIHWVIDARPLRT
jgi:hypothetical protein